ncbi:MAG: hypothetical protein IT327_16130 [Anaerolineae bacterium]|nr:hypothetical protein [Anaerolineae bacterium]
MSLLPDLSNALTTATTVACGELGLVIGPRAERLHMLELSAVLALRGTVWVLDGGNSYNALYVARYIRRATVHLEATLNRITVARAFTCYQMVTLLQETATSACSTALSHSTPMSRSVQAVSPTLILDLLATFGDESIDLDESVRLLRLTLVQLQRLCHLAPVVVSLQPLRQPERAILMELVMNTATHHFVREMPGTAVTQPSLFSSG